jgi:hypothetical protein
MKKTLFILLFVIISGIAKAQSDHLKWYKDYQASVEWNHWIESQPKKRIEVVKAAVKQSKDVRARNNQKARLNKKEDRIRQRIKS